MRGGRLGDEVTSQTQAIRVQSIAKKQFIIILIFFFFGSALRHHPSFLTLHPCSFPPLLVPLQVWQSGSGFRRFLLRALTPAFSLLASWIPLPLSLARFRITPLPPAPPASGETPIPHPMCIHSAAPAIPRLPSIPALQTAAQYRSCSLFLITNPLACQVKGNGYSLIKLGLRIIQPSPCR